MDKVYDANRGKRTQTSGLWLLHKIKYEYIHLTSFSHMRVDLAAQMSIIIMIYCYPFYHFFCSSQVLNSSVADFMELMGDK